MIPIDEQIKHQQNTVKIIEDFDDQESLPKEQAILASLQRLKAIDAVQVPEEPERIVVQIERRIKPKITVIEAHHYDTLRDRLKRESERASEWEAEADKQFQYAGRVLEQANAAESKLAAMLKLGAEPSEEMIAVGGEDLPCPSDAIHVFRAMFAKMMEELK